MEADFAAMDAEAGDDPCPKGKGDKCTCSEEEKRKFAEQKKKDDCQQVEWWRGEVNERAVSFNWLVVDFLIFFLLKLPCSLVPRFHLALFYRLQTSKCPSEKIDIGRRVVYDKRRGMIPGYGGHVPGIHICTQGGNFGNLTRKVLKQTVSSERLGKRNGC